MEFYIKMRHRYLRAVLSSSSKYTRKILHTLEPGSEILQDLKSSKYCSQSGLFQSGHGLRTDLHKAFEPGKWNPARSQLSKSCSQSELFQPGHELGPDLHIQLSWSFWILHTSTALDILQLYYMSKSLFKIIRIWWNFIFGI